MITTNPFLTPPQVESSQSRSWGHGWIYGFQGPAMSILLPVDVQPEDAEAFDMGVLAGQTSAIHGLELPQPCFDLNVKAPALSHLVVPGAEGALTILEIVKHGIFGGIFSGILFVVELSLALETFFDDPTRRLEDAVTALQGQVERLGFHQGFEFFLAGAVDLTVTGCELKVGPILRDLESAEASAEALGRAQWIVVSWRSDQSGGVTVLASSE